MSIWVTIGLLLVFALELVDLAQGIDTLGVRNLVRGSNALLHHFVHFCCVNNAIATDRPVSGRERHNLKAVVRRIVEELFGVVGSAGPFDYCL